MYEHGTLKPSEIRKRMRRRENNAGDEQFGIQTCVAGNVTVKLLV
jgi:hypothetical protein